MAQQEDCDDGTYHSHSKHLIVEYGSLAHVLGQPFRIFSKFVRVFDLYFVATERSPDDKLLHGACILYQYIDNNDDGVPDNKTVYSKLVEMKATMIMFLNERELEKNDDFFEDIDDCHVEVQDLQADETNPNDGFDASLEECFHLVTQGYAQAYPDVFGLERGSHAANCCDSARGGYFKKVPKRYPEHAWFTYYDKTCDHPSMVVEYLYWAMTSILGAQKHRHDIRHEWRLHTPELVMQHDPAIYSLLTEESFNFPKKIPKSHLPAARCEQGSSSASSIASAVYNFFKK